MALSQLARMVTIRLSPEGFKVEFEGAMWGRRYIDQAHRAMLRSYPKYLAEARKKGIGEAEKGEKKDDNRSDRTGTDQGGTDRGITDEGTREGIYAGEEGGLVGFAGEESRADSGAVQCDPGSDGGAGQDDRESDKLLEKGEAVERPRSRRVSSRRS